MLLHIDGLGQNYSNRNGLAMELLQFCTKPLTCPLKFKIFELVTIYSLL